MKDRRAVDGSQRFAVAAAFRVNRRVRFRLSQLSITRPKIRQRAQIGSF